MLDFNILLTTIQVIFTSIPQKIHTLIAKK